MIKPYYKDEGITLYNGDCREVMAQLSGEFFCFTDPPYNVGKDYKGWDDNMPEDKYFEFCKEWIEQVKLLCPENCIYPPKKHLLKYWNMLGENYQQVVLPWSPEGAIRGNFVDQYAVILTNAKPKERIKNVWYKVQMRGMGYFFKEKSFGHPGYTSEDLTIRVLKYLADPLLPILDPFGGTGTTAYIAKKMGRKCVAIEYSEQWCEFIAKTRLSQYSLGL